MKTLLLILGWTVCTGVAQAAPDSMAQRTQACVACHGAQGKAGSGGFFPRIAGKPAGYLHQQLLHFRDGRRSYPAMNYLVAHLSDSYLLAMAEHFAALDLPYPPPQPPAANAQALARGRTLVMEGDRAQNLPACVACHGARLTGVQPAVPGLLGLPRDYISAQFGAWKTGARKAAAPDCMRQISLRLTPQDIAAVSAWLASRPIPAGMAPQPGTMPLDCGSAR